MNYLFFDTETAGLPKSYKAPASDTNNWPRLVQLGWILTDAYGNTIHAGNEIVKPDGFVIPADVAKVHGLTTEKARLYGRHLRDVIEYFLDDVRQAQCLVGHNISFDQHVVGAELYRLGLQDVVSAKRSICTMQSSTDYCQMPGYYGYRYPKLQELYYKLFGCNFEDAHDAMADISATRECFFELKRIGVIPSEKYEEEINSSLDWNAQDTRSSMGEFEEELSTEVTEEDIKNGVEDEFGVVYSRDGKRLLKCKNRDLEFYSIRYGTKVICDKAFSWCLSLQQITIPDSVTNIGDSAFDWCSSLQQITIPDSVTSIGKSAFFSCDSLQQITIPDSVTSIGDNPFEGCNKLVLKSCSERFVVDNGLLIDKQNHIVISCVTNKGQITIPDSVTSIGKSAFFSCDSLQQITIPDSVTSIGDDAFWWCGNLQQIIIPEGTSEKFKEMLPKELWGKLYYLKKAVE